VQKEQIVYSVLAFGNGGWHEQSKVGDMHAARKAAEDLFNAGKCKRVKVDKTFFDGENDRFVTMTIFNRDRGQAKSIPTVVWLLLLAVLGGAVSFAVTYVLASHVI
jgi:hypothetical protein